MKTITNKFINDYFAKNQREKNSNKYDFGHVLIIAGSLGMLGSAVLCAKSALAIGAGVVSCAVPEGIAKQAMEHFLEIMVIPVPSKTKDYFDESSFKFLQNLLQTKKFDAIGFGCGIGRELETLKFKKKFLESVNIPIVIDADGLFLTTKFPQNCIITPHEKEMQRLLNLPNLTELKQNRKKYCRNFAKQNNLICLLKGANTLISDGNEVWQNTTGNPGMATAGSGDVLTGIIAGLLAQDKTTPKIEITKISAFIHGKAGDIAQKKYGTRTMIASDIIYCLRELKI